MNNWFMADPSAAQRAWLARGHYRGGDGCRGESRSPRAGPTIPWGDAGGDHDRATTPRKAMSQGRQVR